MYPNVARYNEISGRRLRRLVDSRLMPLHPRCPHPNSRNLGLGYDMVKRNHGYRWKDEGMESFPLKLSEKHPLTLPPSQDLKEEHEDP